MRWNPALKNLSNAHAPYAFLEPTDPILEQDKCFSSIGIDLARWSHTVFLPLTLVGDGRSYAIAHTEALVDHLGALERKALELGVTGLRTEILSCEQPVSDMAIISSLRGRLMDDATVIGTTSITWTVIRVSGSWKINQILFNDTVRDPSITAQVFLGHPNKKNAGHLE